MKLSWGLSFSLIRIIKTKKTLKKEDGIELQDHHEQLPDITGLKARGLVGLPYLSDCKKDVTNPEEETPPRVSDSYEWFLSFSLFE